MSPPAHDAFPFPPPAPDAVLRYRILHSPAGPLTIAGRDGLIESLRFGDTPPPGGEPGAFDEAIRQLYLYFAGRLRTFDLPLRPAGTDFQLRVWAALLDIPFGETRSYGTLAAQLGNPAAVRAVGLANGANPIAIVIPCHRVIGAAGQLTGYAGGLDVKRRLLALERGEALLV
jgi:methylated-DNA-[protein]-cysteine S-methyltransferase